MRQQMRIQAIREVVGESCPGYYPATCMRGEVNHSDRTAVAPSVPVDHRTSFAVKLPPWVIPL